MRCLNGAFLISLASESNFISGQKKLEKIIPSQDYFQPIKKTEFGTSKNVSMLFTELVRTVKGNPPTSVNNIHYNCNTTENDLALG